MTTLCDQPDQPLELACLPAPRTYRALRRSPTRIHLGDHSPPSRTIHDSAIRYHSEQPLDSTMPSSNLKRTLCVAVGAAILSGAMAFNPTATVRY